MKRRNLCTAILALALSAALLLGAPSCVLAAATTSVSAETLESGRQLTLTGMCYNGKYSPIKELNGETLSISTVQNFAFTPDGKYVFTTGECRTGTTKHTLLSRCAMPETPGHDAEAPFLQGHVLENYGHGECIAITQPDPWEETYDIWVATTVTDGRFGTEIARMTYVVREGVGVIVKNVRITNFKKANVVNRKAAFFKKEPTPRRLNVAIDEAANRIMFRVQFPAGQGVNYVCYDYRKINNALNALADGSTFDIAKAAAWQKANVRTSNVPFGSFQSFAIDGNTLYVCGGNTQKGAQIYAMKFKVYANGRAVQQNLMKAADISRIIDIEPGIIVEGRELGRHDLEIEGMKLRKNGGRLDFFVNFFMKGTSIRNHIGIYRFTA